MVANVTALIDKMKMVSSMNNIVAQQLPSLLGAHMAGVQAAVTAHVQPAIAQATAATAQVQAALAAQATQQTQLQQQSQRLTQQRQPVPPPPPTATTPTGVTQAANFLSALGWAQTAR